VFAFNESINLGDIVQSVTFIAAVGAACWKASRWQATLELEVKDGFARNDIRHAEIREELKRQVQILSDHGEHLASLDERTALLLRRPD
jgi:hypothetical protein